MVRCPHCQNKHYPLWTKFWPVPGAKFDCPTCERPAAVAPLIYVLAALVLIGVLVASFISPSGALKWEVLGIGILFILLAAWVIPLVRR